MVQAGRVPGKAGGLKRRMLPAPAARERQLLATAAVWAVAWQGRLEHRVGAMARNAAIRNANAALLPAMLERLFILPELEG